MIPTRLRLGAILTTLGLTLWMTYALASVIFAAPDIRDPTLELAIDALVIVGVTANLHGGLLEHRSLTARAERSPLTGLFNRAGANRAWTAMPPGTAGTLAVVDLNELKAVNDQQRHDAGDAPLLACAAELRRVRGSSGVAARWGGDEFVLDLPELAIEQARERPARAAGRISIGMGELPVWAVGTIRTVTGAALREAMPPADAAMYRPRPSSASPPTRPTDDPPPPPTPPSGPTRTRRRSSWRANRRRASCPLGPAARRMGGLTMPPHRTASAAPPGAELAPTAPARTRSGGNS